MKLKNGKIKSNNLNGIMLTCDRCGRKVFVIDEYRMKSGALMANIGSDYYTLCPDCAAMFTLMVADFMTNSPNNDEEVVYFTPMKKEDEDNG